VKLAVCVPSFDGTVLVGLVDTLSFDFMFSVAVTVIQRDSSTMTYLVLSATLGETMFPIFTGWSLGYFGAIAFPVCALVMTASMLFTYAAVHGLGMDHLLKQEVYKQRVRAKGGEGGGAAAAQEEKCEERQEGQKGQEDAEVVVVVVVAAARNGNEGRSSRKDSAGFVSSRGSGSSGTMLGVLAKVPGVKQLLAPWFRRYADRVGDFEGSESDAYDGLDTATPSGEYASQSMSSSNSSIHYHKKASESQRKDTLDVEAAALISVGNIKR
jgi:hypothetical protein